MEVPPQKKRPWFWSWSIAAVIFRLVLVYFPSSLNLSSRPEVSTPVTSLRRLAEGYWLKQSSMSPYADFVTALLIRATGQNLQVAYGRSLELLGLSRVSENSEFLPSGDIAALLYLWNPFTIVTCVGSSTSPVENFFIVLSLYGACTRLVPLAAFGWVIASHLSLYPAVIVIPAVLLLGYGPDAPPRKYLLQSNDANFGDNLSSDSSSEHRGLKTPAVKPANFLWRPVVLFLSWASVWALYVVVLCWMSVKEYGGLWEMFKRTYGFIITVQDLSPNIGVLWYFFAEVFDFFRSFFLIVFHMNILVMILPLAIRLNHRPFFLAVVYIAISSMLKSYPSVSDSALYLSLLALFINELADIQFSFFLFCGYVGVSLLSPVMHNLWIWRGTGNANFYFATAMAYACFQIVLVVECVNAMLNHDRMIRKKLSTTKA
ncbi:hypothetical protein RJ639_042325 [Escallonia herrerae]|uniref:Phosphatidylinositol glycan anchor biosynthesis class U protein n=1 Tax=Escallonia herrerae TaxID=1293975 RepID=A0AA89BCD8_9ASTE|nr:hypothetical protein RJ639_042325 [Escallonia herrerae]